MSIAGADATTHRAHDVVRNDALGVHAAHSISKLWLLGHLDYGPPKSKIAIDEPLAPERDWRPIRVMPLGKKLRASAFALGLLTAGVGHAEVSAENRAAAQALFDD